MATEDKLTLTQTNPDGSQQVLEITSKTMTSEEVASDPSLLEMIIDAIFDNGTEEHETYLVPAGYVEASGPVDPPEWVPPSDWDLVAPVDGTGAMLHDATPVLTPDSELGGSTDWSLPLNVAPLVTVEEAGNLESASDLEPGPTNDYTQAARDAQSAADDFVSRGDYRAAQEAREQAEAAAGLAGDDNMLGGYDSQNLGFAADKQDLADQYRQEQTDLLHQGDYEGARESALQSGYATRDADSLAGGSDHSGQSGRDVHNLDWATWNETNAEENLFNAQQAANDGNFEQAQMYTEQAGWQQSSADQFADQANPESLQWNVDPSSAVETGGSYEAAVNSIDTGFTPTTDYSSGADFSSDGDDMTC